MAGRALILCLMIWLGGFVTLAQAADILPAPGTEVFFKSQTLVHDDIHQTVTAEGQVEFIYQGQVLKAHRVIYDLRTEIVRAVGDVVLLDETGDVHFADQVQLTKQMQEGYVTALRSTLADGSRFWADKGQRLGPRVTMQDARYTPCAPCQTDPDAAPAWQMKAKGVVKDTAAKTVTYDQAWFELYGVPLLYMPYFSHADSSVKQKSGFLTPLVKLDSRNGANVTTRYYWAISPSRDATLGAQVFTKQSPRLTGEYRQRFERAELMVRGSATSSERVGEKAGQLRVFDAEPRGHLEATARWDINTAWRAGTHLELVSDKQYLRQYDVTSKDVLENEVYAERLVGRDYFVARMLAFQDVRTSDREIDQPNILPEIQSSFYTTPNAVLGGRLRFDASALGLERGTGGDDMTRFSGSAAWQRRWITPPGVVLTADTALRADAYAAINRAAGSPTDDFQTRLVPMGQLTAAYPLARPLPGGVMTLEPSVAATAIPRQTNTNKIPNEDSQDLQLDTSNLFAMNRFPGLDRIEDSSRITYGVRTGVDRPEDWSGDVFMGQSRRWVDDDRAVNPYPVNSGLRNKKSDYVGRVRVHHPEILNLDYTIQLDGQTGASVRHELEGGATLGRVQFSTLYLYAKTIEGVGLNESREQIQGSVRYDLGGDWYARTAAHYDLGEDPGLRKLQWGLDYQGECITLATTVERNLTNAVTGESGAELMFRIGLKNLGEFQTAGIGLASGRGGNQE